MKPVLCKGVDISSLNESYADLSIIQKAGYTFAMIRCAQGTRIIDSWFDRNVEAAEKLGMPWGAYILTEAVTDYQAKAEAELVDKLLKKQLAKGYKPTFPIAIDIEEAGFSDKDYTPLILSNTASVWVSEMKRMGYYPMIYTGFYDIRDYLSKDVVNSCDIWLAEWGRHPDYQEDNLGLWQFSDGDTDLVEYKPIIPGLVWPVDKNYSYKDYPTIIKEGGWNGWDKESPKPKPSPSAKKPVEMLAFEVLDGYWDAGEERKKLLTEAGYDYKAVQSRVNEICASWKNPTLDETGYKLGESNIAILAIKELLSISKKLGIITQGVSENKVFGDGTLIAVNQILKLGNYNQNGVMGENFVKYLSTLIKEKNHK